MEKLIELLNEYENRDEDQQIEWRVGEGDKGEKGKVRGIVNEVYMGWVSELVVCSAHYGFIKWLVDNDKIDFENRDLKDKFMENFERYPYPPYTDFSLEGLIMLLAIQNNPIQFLISILKTDD